MAFSGLLMIVLGMGGCALVAVVLIGVVWALADERRSRRRERGEE